MISIRAVLLIAGTAALVGATAASAQTARQGQHNSDGTRGMRAYSAMIGDASIEGASESGRTIATASKVLRTEKTVIVAEKQFETATR